MVLPQPDLSCPWEAYPFLNRDEGGVDRGYRLEVGEEEDRRQGKLWSVYKINEININNKIKKTCQSF